MAIPDDIKMTPWLSQYRQWKAEYPDALLLFRMGDFYELFFDDARTAASILDIALTARDAERKIPMAGVPHTFVFAKQCSRLFGGNDNRYTF